METVMKKSNLFNYATSELSQDAILCWLIAHAADEKHNPGLAKAAEAFLQLMYKPYSNEEYAVEICKQYKNIDILLKLYKKTAPEIVEKYIIIEDKTFTGSHGDQINRYRNSLIAEIEGVENKKNGPDLAKEFPKTNDKIICVYYKIVEQAHKEKNVDVEITRTKMLNEVLLKYSEAVADNTIFKDYTEYLLSIESEVNSWEHTSLPFEKWSANMFRGFFKHLAGDPHDEIEANRNHIIGFKKEWDYGWNYVSNPNRGFWCLYWYPVNLDPLKDLMYQAFDIDCFALDEMYLQTELVKAQNNSDVAYQYVVTLKMNMGQVIKDDPHKDEKIKSVQMMAKMLRDIIKPHLKDKGYGTKSLQPGRTMSVCHVAFNNVDEFKTAMETMQDCVDNLLSWTKEYIEKSKK